MATFERRVFLKMTGWLASLCGIPASARAAGVEKSAPPLDSRLVAPMELQFHAYSVPSMVGWKGYWYRQVSGSAQEIMAFEDLDGQRIATPWALQAPDWAEERRAFQTDVQDLYRRYVRWIEPERKG